MADKCLLLCVLCCLGQFILAIHATENIPLGLDQRHLPRAEESSKFCSNKSLVCSEASTTRSQCPPAFFCVDGRCKCRPSSNIIKCNKWSSSALMGYCVTYDDKSDTVSTGSCIYSVEYGYKHTNVSAYYQLPNDTHLLQNLTCKPFNRTGVLCGRCLPQHFPLAYSFDSSCVPCPPNQARWNVFWYILAAFGPLTFFYLILLFLKPNFTSSHFFAVLYFSQNFASPVVLRSLQIVVNKLGNPHFVTAYKIVMSLYGVWNLDFGRPFYSKLCLRIGILPSLALEYAIAAYPLFLIAITYLLIVMYERNYRIITIMWTPFRIATSLFKKNWNIRTSVINTFATFVFLSNVKFLNVSFNILAGTQVHQLHQNTSNSTLGLLYAGDIPYLGREHRPYAVLAIIVTALFIIPPISILAFYQLFEKVLSLFRCRCHTIRTFVHTFHGYYKNGSTDGRDLRWFVSTFFISRCCILLINTLMHSGSMIVSVALVVFLLHSILLIILQPFKSPALNIINAVFLQLQSFIVAAVISINYANQLVNPEFAYFFYILLAILCMIPLLYILAACLHWIYTNKRSASDLCARWRAWINSYKLITQPSEGSSIADHRREDIDQYCD